MAEDKREEEKSEFQELIELMTENNRATGEIEADGRNTRRHLLEMKNMQKVALETSASINFGFENFFEMMDANKLADQERAAEQYLLFDSIRETLQEGIKTKPEEKEKKKKDGGGMKVLGKLGAMMGPIAMAAGGLLAGVGIGAAGLTYAMGQMEDMDTQKIKDNVGDLLGLADDPRMTPEAVAGVSATMLALGVGLAAFSLGEGAAKAIGKFESEADWTGKIKENIADLLSIADLENMTPKHVAGVSATLGALGVGLAAFGIGKAADGVGEAISKFSGGGNFAQGIKDEVETLLSIKTEGFGKTTGLVATLGGLGLGLAAFAVGKAGSGVAAGLDKFTTGGNFADNIKEEVETLLSIDTGKDGQVGDFVGTMGALAAGLVAFAIGKGASSTADAIDKFTDGDFAETISQQVDTLLMVGDNASAERTAKATTVLAALGVGLATFAAGKGLNTLADLGASIVGFFTGSKSPVEQAIEVGEKADQIEAGAIAFEKFLDVFQKFADMSNSIELDTNIDEAIEDLDNYTRVLETIVQGGTLTKGRNFNTDGLANITEDVDKAIANVSRLRDVLKIETGGQEMQQNDSVAETSNKIINLSAENMELKLPEAFNPAAMAAAMGTSSNSIITDNSSKTEIAVMQQSQPDKIDKSVQGPY